MKRQTKRADEVDAVEARHHLVWRRGEVREIKRRMNRRERHEARRQAAQDGEMIMDENLATNAAVLRTLRDIADGHINLWCMMSRSRDAAPGGLVPMELVTTPDRGPAVGFPAPTDRWWEVLAEQGWIAPTGGAEGGREFWELTDAGREVLRVGTGQEG